MYISIIYDHAIYSVVQCSIMHMTLHFSIPRVLRLRCAARCPQAPKRHAAAGGRGWTVPRRHEGGSDWTGMG